MSKRGQEATPSEGSPMETTQFGSTQPVEREKHFTEFGVSGKSGEMPMNEKSGNSTWKQLAIRFKIRSRIFSSVSIRECSNGPSKQLA